MTGIKANDKSQKSSILLQEIQFLGTPNKMKWNGWSRGLLVNSSGGGCFIWWTAKSLGHSLQCTLCESTSDLTAVLRSLA